MYCTIVLSHMRNHHSVPSPSNLYLEVDLIMLIEQSGLGVTDVQISAGFGRKSHHHFAHLSAFQLHEFT